MVSRPVKQLQKMFHKAGKGAEAQRVLLARISRMTRCWVFLLH